MVETLNAYPFEKQNGINVLSAVVGFENVQGIEVAREYTGAAPIVWQSFDWSNIPAASFNDWLTGLSNESINLIELSPANFITAGGLIAEETTGSQEALTVNIDTNQNDLFTDYLIYFDEYNPSSLSASHSAGLYSAVRSADATTQDYTDFTVHDDALRLAELQALGNQKKALHFWAGGVGTGAVNFDIPNVKAFNHFDHRDNREAMPYLKGLGQDFDGLSYNLTQSVLAPEKDAPQIIVCSFFYTPGTVQRLFRGQGDNANVNVWYDLFLSASGAVQLKVFNNTIFSTIPNNFISFATASVLKSGYNNLIIEYRGVNSGECNIYINGHKSVINYFTGGAGVVPTATTTPRNYGIGVNFSTLGASSIFNGKMKVLQWLDVTGQSITPATIKAIAEQQSASNLLDFSNAVFDIDFSASPISDNSPNGYTVNTVNGLTQSNYL